MAPELMRQPGSFATGVAASMEAAERDRDADRALDGKRAGQVRDDHAGAHRTGLRVVADHRGRAAQVDAVAEVRAAGVVGRAVVDRGDLVGQHPRAGRKRDLVQDDGSAAGPGKSNGRLGAQERVRGAGGNGSRRRVGGASGDHAGHQGRHGDRPSQVTSDGSSDGMNVTHFGSPSIRLLGHPERKGEPAGNIDRRHG